MSKNPVARRAVRVRAALVAVLVLLSLAAPGVLAGEPALQFPEAGEPPVVSSGISTDRSGLRGLWFQWENEFAEGDLDAARKTVEEIRRQQKRLGVRRLTEMSMAAIAAARRAAKDSRSADAEEAFRLAIEFDPTLPDADFSWADHLWSTRSYPSALTHYATGSTKIMQNIISRRSVAASAGIVLSLAALAGALVLWLAIVFRHGASFFHDIHELFDEKLGRVAASVVGFAVLFAPIFLTFGPPYAIAFSLLVVWGYASPVERLTATLAQLLLASSAAGLLFFSAEAVAIHGPIFVGAVDLAEHRYDPAVIDRLEELNAANTSNAELWYLLGSLYRDAGRNERAQAYFRRALELDKTLAPASVNLGSVLYLEGDISAAILEFRRATEIDPGSAIAFYNLSVALNEMSNFEDGRKMMGEATRIDSSSVSRWVRENQRIQNADLPLERARQKSAMLEGDLDRRSAGPYTNATTVGVLLLAFATPFVHVLRKKKLPYAGACVKCGRTYCRLCKAATESGIYCSQCVHIFLKKDGVAIDTKMAKVEEVKVYLRREEARRRWSSLLLPGVAQVVSGQPIRGLLLGLGFFVFLFAAILIGHLYRPVTMPTRFFDFLSWVLGAVAFAIWFAANFRIVRPLRVEN